MPSTPRPTMRPTCRARVPPPAYVPPAPAAPNPTPVYAPAPPTVPLATPPAALPGSTLAVQLPTTPLPQTSTVTRLVQLPTQPLPQGQARLLSSQGLLTSRPSLVPGSQHILQLQQPGAVQVRQPFVAQPPILRQPAVQTITTPVAAQTGQRRNLSLTKDQMLEAQEMFRTANKVTRPEKALILGFMAGSRDNPCPHLGNIVTIKLSENQENVPQTDNTYLTMIVETHFQMNYNTGEWKRIKKYRRLEDVLQQQQQQQ